VKTKRLTYQFSMALILILIIAISIGHYLIPTTHHHLHEIFRRLYFFPILLAALQYGFRSGFLIAFIISLIYLPHVVFQWSGSFLSNLVRFNEILLYLLIGGLSGLLSDRTRKERDRYRDVAEELDQAYQKLKQQSDQMAELEHQLRGADRMAVLGELTASLAHEVRNPLGSIKGAADILKKRCKSDKTCLEFPQILADEVDRLNQVVDNYLTIARHPAASGETTNVIAALESIFQLVGPQIRKQNIQIQTDWPDSPVSIPMSEVEARQVFLNLALNALAALTPGGMIHIQILKSDQTVIIHFSNNGPGIPENQLETIFTPFYTTKKEGTGLGLAIVKRLVESRTGTIEVESQMDKGITFTLTFYPKKIT